MCRRNKLAHSTFSPEKKGVLHFRWSLFLLFLTCFTAQTVAAQSLKAWDINTQGAISPDLMLIQEDSTNEGLSYLVVNACSPIRCNPRYPEFCSGAPSAFPLRNSAESYPALFVPACANEGFFGIAWYTEYHLESGGNSQHLATRFKCASINAGAEPEFWVIYPDPLTHEGMYTWPLETNEAPYCD